MRLFNVTRAYAVLKYEEAWVEAETKQEAEQAAIHDADSWYWEDCDVYVKPEYKNVILVHTEDCTPENSAEI